MSQKVAVNEIDYSVYNFRLRIEESGVHRGDMSKTVNIYSYMEYMLCEIPIYEVNQAVSESENPVIELNLTDRVASYEYVMVNIKDSSALSYKSIEDQAPLSIDFRTLSANVFSFNDQVLNIQQNAKKKIYKLNDHTVEEYLEQDSLKLYVTKLFYSDESRNSNFSFSSALEHLRKRKLQKIYIDERVGTNNQIVSWELQKSTKITPNYIVSFFSNYIKRP